MTTSNILSNKQRLRKKLFVFPLIRTIRILLSEVNKHIKLSILFTSITYN